MKSKKTAFVFCCRYTRENCFIYDSVESVIKHHPEADIIIVDSSSEDCSYFNIQDMHGNVRIEEFNTQYELAAWLGVFKKYKQDYKTFVFLQDSIKLLDPLRVFNKEKSESKDLSDLSDDEVVLFMNYKKGWASFRNNPHGEKEGYTDLKAWWVSMYPEFPMNDEIFINPTFWNTFAINTDAFSKVLNSESFKMIDTKSLMTKAGSVVMECIWTLLFHDSNLKIRKIIGTNPGYDTFLKNWVRMKRKRKHNPLPFKKIFAERN